MESSPFYASGLKFTCTRCSSCCRYDTGYVYLSEKDLKGLTDEFKMDREQFINNYCVWVFNTKGKEALSLKEKINKDCILWENGCSVYSARPLQCRTFPFWESIVKSRENWEIAACGCPGMNKGSLFSAENIAKQLEMRYLDPIIYR